MSVETDLQKLARHWVDILNINRESIITEDHELVFNEVGYGEPRVVLTWPYLSVQPITKTRSLSAMRKFALTFNIDLMLYYGEIGKIQQTQENLHRRAEALERFCQLDRKWNFIDRDDPTKDKVIHGQVNSLDHPVTIAGDQLWSASRLQLEALSEEYFTNASD